MIGVGPLFDFIERQESVGFSDGRTPVKHRLVNGWAGMDVGAAIHVARKYHRPYGGHSLVDLTAGDAVGDGRNDWWCGSSPAIFAKLAAQNKLVRVRLYEKNLATFQALVTNLAASLPSIGFRQGETSWQHRETGSTVDAFFGDARDLEQFALRPNEWLFVNDDPNNMHGLVLDLGRLQGVIKRPSAGFVTFLSTMGCNAGGLKMLSLEHRQWWFRHIEQATKLVADCSRLDLVLFEIINDKAQWAYLLLVPKIWVEDRIKPFRKEFERQGLSVIAYSWWNNRQRFKEAIGRLFYTKQERANGRFWEI